MEFRILGPLDVRDDSGAVLSIATTEDRSVLLMLLLYANQTVAAERLGDALWGARRPAAAPRTIRSCVSRLRRLLGSGQRARIITRPPGYMLRLEPGELDRDRFEALVEAARVRDDSMGSLELLREALTMWRGPPMQEFALDRFARDEIARLEELRRVAVGERDKLERRLRTKDDVVGDPDPGPGDEAKPALRELGQPFLHQDADPGAEAFARPETGLHTPSAPAAPRVPRSAPEVRKTVTVLFADLVASSHLSHALDPEALHGVLARYFGELSATVRRHGGVVEKYIGDALMAVFGVPVLHEDDALRAVRAAVEMRHALGVLNREFEQDLGLRLATRFGVNTGEVIAGDIAQGHLFVTGEAVYGAKRLEEVASANEILIGRPTYDLVRDAVVVEPSGARVPKHGDPIRAFVVLDVHAHLSGRSRRVDSPFVGRERQLATLARLFDDMVRERACRLVTVLGDAGVGKSRLVREFTGGLAGNATIVHGRCLPYGEGITYWPLAEIVREITRAGGLEPGKQAAATIAAKLEGDERADLIAESVTQALGLGGAGGGTSEQTFWAVRRLFEALARSGPLVVVVDDVHWAESTFLDLIDHVADFSRDSAILIVCLARPDLLDTRPGWAAGKPNATSIRIGPLSPPECRELISNLLDRVPLSADAEAKIADAAEGNALFAEELVAMLVDERLLTREDDCWVAAPGLAELPVPATIHALLAARLEGLPVAERAILTTAAVEGAVFHRRSIAELAPTVPDAELDDALRALVGRDLLRQEVPDFSGEEAYRFRHLLIRDAAYRSLAKHARADLHERYAYWLAAAAAERLHEYEEIVGYHLEQAFRYRVELGSRDLRTASLGVRASERLEAAGRRALVRSDLPAAIGLLERASRLLPTGEPRRMALLAELGTAQIKGGRLIEAGRVLGEAERLASAAGDERLSSHVLVQRHLLRLLHVEDGRTEDAAQAAATVIPVFEACRDDLGLCRARRLEAWLHWNDARADAAAESWERAAAHARLAGDRHEHDEILTWIASSLWFGPTRAEEGIRRCEAMREEVRDSPESVAAVLRHLAGLHAMVGHFTLARQLIATSNAAYADLGLSLNAATSQNEAVIELLAGNPAAAEQSLRIGYRALEQMGERAFRSTTAAFLAQAILDQGRDEEAAEVAELSSRLAAPGDRLTQSICCRVRARVLARRARLQEAEALAREAVAITEATDFLNFRADALLDLAQVIGASHRFEEAAAAATQALRLYELKGNIVAAAATRLRLGELGRIGDTAIAADSAAR